MDGIRFGLHVTQGGKGMKPLADIVSTNEFESWTDEGQYYIHLIDKEVTISFTEDDFDTFVKNIVKTHDVSKYLDGLK